MKQTFRNVIGIFLGIPFELILRDLAQWCKASLGIGLISNIGYLLWMSSASIALFTSFLGLGNKGNHAKSFTRYGGCFSLFLCIDDMFLLHDRYIPEEVLYPVYGTLAIILLNRSFIFFGILK